ncbi:hypothetical protein AGLY_006394 [Aphis glycines]|uniref:Uncharacterized protein n=1 Tax=Aphis glycines TaxID=307491 RepID=A0A6G0TT96_APHGL|nr:hypothetical protein AGLY_006394 [Aphis glycines]
MFILFVSMVKSIMDNNNTINRNNDNSKSNLENLSTKNLNSDAFLEVFDITLVVLIICIELIYIEQVLFVVLSKLKTIHGALIELNVVRPMKIKMNWLCTIGIFLNFTGFNIHLLILYNKTCILRKQLLLIKSCICLVRWYHVINEHILERRLYKSILRDIHLDVIECLKDGSIYGISAIVGFVASNISQIILTNYNQKIFSRNINTEVELVDVTISILTILMNIMVLYGMSHATEKEINRMSLVFYQRSVIEKIPRIKLQIKFIILRRLHEHYHFGLYGICHINPKQLLILSNKAFAYLVIQICSV